MENLGIEIRTIKLTKINKVSRNIINVKTFIRKALNTPQRVQPIRISNHLATNNKKDLEKSIVTEINYYKDKQVIKVRTDIDSRFLKAI